MRVNVTSSVSSAQFFYGKKQIGSAQPKIGLYYSYMTLTALQQVCPALLNKASDAVVVH